jgi:hypothetical protein
MDTRLTALRKEKRVETAMQMQKEIEALSRMTVGQLRQKYLEVFGEESRSNHKQFLFRRIAWRIQALAEGGLSERARRRALEIANDADLRIRAPRTMFGQDPTLNPKLSVTPYSPRYSCGEVVLEQAAEPLATTNTGRLSWRPTHAGREQQEIVLTLMISFLVKVVEIVGDHTS